MASQYFMIYIYIYIYVILLFEAGSLFLGCGLDFTSPSTRNADIGGKSRLTVRRIPPPTCNLGLLPLLYSLLPFVPISLLFSTPLCAESCP